MLEDERAILQTLHQYGHAMDYGPDADFVDCFTREGVWDVQMRSAPAGSFQCCGHGEIEASLAGQTAVRAPALYAKHFVMDPQIVVTGDEASVVSYFLRVEPRDGATDPDRGVGSLPRPPGAMRRRALAVHRARRRDRRHVMVQVMRGSDQPPISSRRGRGPPSTARAARA